jgi:hypothetical protein
MVAPRPHWGRTFGFRSLLLTGDVAPFRPLLRRLFGFRSLSLFWGFGEGGSFVRRWDGRLGFVRRC